MSDQKYKIFFRVTEYSFQYFITVSCISAKTLFLQVKTVYRYLTNVVFADTEDMITQIHTTELP